MNKKMFLIMLLLLQTTFAYAAQQPVTVGTEAEKADIDTNFANIQANFTELYDKDTSQDANIADIADLPIVVVPPATDGDDTAMIQTAIAELGGNPGVLQFGLGSYLTDPITIDTAVTIKGMGIGNTTLRLSAGANDDLLTVTASYTQISDLTLHGDKGNNTAGSALVIYTAARVVAENLYIKNAAEDGIYVEGTGSATGSHANKYSNISIIDCDGYGLNLQAYSYDSQINNLWIGTCGGGVNINSGDNFFTNLHVWGSTADGVQVRTGRQRFLNCYIEHNGAHGFDLAYASYTLINNSKIWANTNNGIYLAENSSHTGIINNQIHGNGDAGVALSDSTYNTIIGNHFYDLQDTKTQDHGIIESGTSDYNKITGNIANDTDHVVAGIVTIGANTVIMDEVSSGSVTIDTEIIDGSTNPVTGDAIEAALAGKQDAFTGTQTVTPTGLAVVTAADAAAARTAISAETADATILKDADIGVTVQGTMDADDVTGLFSGTGDYLKVDGTTGTPTAGSFALDTFPVYEDSAHSSGFAVNGTQLAVYSDTAGEWGVIDLDFTTLSATPSIADAGSNTGDTLSETWNGATTVTNAGDCDNAWGAATVEGSCTLDADYTIADYGFSGDGLRTVIGGGNNESYLNSLSHTAITELSARVYIKVVSNSWSSNGFFIKHDGTSGPHGLVLLDDGTIEISVDGTVGTFTPVDGTIYRIQYRIDPVDDTWAYEVHSVNASTGALTSVGSDNGTTTITDGGYSSVSQVGIYSSGDGTELIVGYFDIDSDASAFIGE